MEETPKTQNISSGIKFLELVAMKIQSLFIKIVSREIKTSQKSFRM